MAQLLHFDLFVSQLFRIVYAILAPATCQASLAQLLFFFKLLSFKKNPWISLLKIITKN